MAGDENGENWMSPGGILEFMCKRKPLKVLSQDVARP